jgi:hypothetical protein
LRVLSVTAIAAFVGSYFFVEDPKGAIAEMMPDGAVTMIEITEVGQKLAQLRLQA